MEIRPNTWVNDMYLDEKDEDLMHVEFGVDWYDVSVFPPRQVKEMEPAYICFCVSLSYMNIEFDGDSDWEIEFAKDIQRDVDTFYNAHHRIPTPSEMRELTEIHCY